MKALRSSIVEVDMSGALNIVNPPYAARQRRFLSSADKGRAEFFVDLPDFLYAVDIGLVNAFRPAAAAVIASGTELAINSARAP